MRYKIFTILMCICSVVGAEDLQKCAIRFNSLRSDPDKGYARCIEKNTDKTFSEYILATDVMQRGIEEGKSNRVEEQTMICLHKRLCSEVTFSGHILDSSLATKLEIGSTSKFAKDWRCTCESSQR